VISRRSVKTSETGTEDRYEELRDFMETIHLYRVICRQPTFPYSNTTQWTIQVPRTLPLTAYQEAEITNPP